MAVLWNTPTFLFFRRDSSIAAVYPRSVIRTYDCFSRTLCSYNRVKTDTYERQVLFLLVGRTASVLL